MSALARLAALREVDPITQEEVNELAEEIVRVSFAAAVERREVWRDMDRRFSKACAERLAVAIRAAGGPASVRVWTVAGHAPRVCFPCDAGYLSVGLDGGVSSLSRGRQTFREGALFPAWRRAVRAAVAGYHADLGRHLAAHGQARAQV